MVRAQYIVQALLLWVVLLLLHLPILLTNLFLLLLPLRVANISFHAWNYVLVDNCIVLEWLWIFFWSSPPHAASASQCRFLYLVYCPLVDLTEIGFHSFQFCTAERASCRLTLPPILDALLAKWMSELNTRYLHIIILGFLNTSKQIMQVISAGYTVLSAICKEGFVQHFLGLKSSYTNRSAW